MNAHRKGGVVDAVRWTGEAFDGHGPDFEPRHPWLVAAMLKRRDERGAVYRIGSAIHVRTEDGVLTASPGDWVVFGEHGAVFPCTDAALAALTGGRDA